VRIITLLTDFGTVDSYVAEVKAAVLANARDVLFVDVTHEIPPADLRAAQYVLSRAWYRFPAGTIHVCVVDPEVGTSRRALAARNQEHYFVAPDNGLLTPVLDGAEVVALPIPESAAPTFHGRDVFAPAAGSLAAGEPLASLGTAVADAVRLPLPALRREGDWVIGEVVYVDRFGNAVTNIPGDVLGAGARVRGRTIPAARTFADVARESLLAYVGSGGTVEVAAREGRASEIAGLRVGEEVRVAARA
jgi:hypothetical protein